jgi:hypothetical protein
MDVSERVERNILLSIVNEEVDNHCYCEFSIRKIYLSGALDRSSIINCKRRKMQGFPFAVSERVERNLLRSIINGEINNHCYLEFSIRKIYHTWALEPILDN